MNPEGLDAVNYALCIKKLAGIITIIATLMLTSCHRPMPCAGQCQSQESDETMYQVSTLQSLLDGGYDGHITVQSLLTHGDIGVGTYDRIDGEMIVLDGTAYQARHDGSVQIAADETTVPFANVTHFDVDTIITLDKVKNMDEMADRLTNGLSRSSINSPLALRSIYVARIDVRDCDSIRVRSELPQRPPYRPLELVMQTDQREYTYRNVSGTIVALYFPDHFAKQNSTGWHLHFISDDRTKGGHVMDIATSAESKASIDITSYYYLYMP